MNNQIVITSLLTFLYYSFSFAQEHVKLEGKLIDAETKKPLSFATINIQNSPLGVVANEQGAFEFSFPKKHLKDSIVFAFMGYESEKQLAQSLDFAKPLTVSLVCKAVMLSEVVVTDKKLTAWEILELVMDNIKENYPTDPFEFSAFYRDYKIENDKCVGLFESAITVFDKGYSKVANKHSFKEKVKLDQVRKSLSTKFQNHAFRRVNVIKELLKLNDIRYQSRAFDKRRVYSYELDGYDVIDDRLMYKIKAVDTWTFYIYVDVATYAVPKIEMNFDWVDDVAENEWILGDTIKYQQRHAKQTFYFQRIDGLYYPKYHSFISDQKAFDPNTNELLFTAYLLQEYMVTDINFDPTKLKKDERMDPYEVIENQYFTYDPEFWANYNVIKLHPRDEKLIQGLEDQIRLEDQFSANQ